jgi:hypothetical protein
MGLRAEQVVEIILWLIADGLGLDELLGTSRPDRKDLLGL